jgi:uroporphyrinogen III methyltransferase/synthase
MKEAKGICYLVGAGPGDLGLVTLRAKECIELADVLVYDALSSGLLLSWTRKDCEKIFVGKRAKNHALSQDEINALIVERTQAGKSVVRLKGGDPMIFGRGGEEAAELAAAGVAFEIVPGISSTIGGPCYAGIPVTHRDHCSQLTIFTGHEDPSKGESSIDYAQLAKAPGTKVFVMGIARLREICAQFIQHGTSAETPMALVRWATTPQQWTLVGTVGTMADIAESHGFTSPAVAVIGDVVRERESIRWFDTRPLFGKRIVVTRTREQAGTLSKELANLGADVVELPVIRMEHPQDKLGFAECVAVAHEYDWIVFTSPNGVEKFFEAFFSIHDDARCLGKPRIAVIGPGTAAKLKEFRIGVDLMPEKHVAEGLVEAFQQESIENLTILVVKPEQSRDVVSQGLADMGAIIDDCIAYRTVAETTDPTGAVEMLREQGADVITFTSASTVEHYFALGIPWPKGCKAGSIGPVTSDALRKIGHPPDFEATDFNIPGLVNAIKKHMI